ncbi:MAG: hypothetical protein IJ736_00010, partial [Firmicutes bacterium]|nr:hypothetical protein [Bacillota bacterium]
MKKLISIIISVALCMSISACSSGQNNTADNTSKVTQNDEEKSADNDSENAVKYNAKSYTHKAGLRRLEAKAVQDENPEMAIRRSKASPFQIVGTMINGESLPPDFYLYRNVLNDYQRKAYDEIHLGIMRVDEAVI